MPMSADDKVRFENGGFLDVDAREVSLAFSREDLQLTLEIFQPSKQPVDGRKKLG